MTFKWWTLYWAWIIDVRYYKWKDDSNAFYFHFTITIHIQICPIINSVKPVTIGVLTRMGKSHAVIGSMENLSTMWTWHRWCFLDPIHATKKSTSTWCWPAIAEEWKSYSQSYLIFMVTRYEDLSFIWWKSNIYQNIKHCFEFLQIIFADWIL